ncbi:MAG: crossover junction endodeoxyribonuclease RuvC [Kiritimatiellae bacterium]|nr:crossover junction endodeoxyribonuclease RuvC [Kiritimatiellia bacterium]MBR4945483.1 crossover junction endodeoxyribonuclease RuvC [Kiritimatiellia bacterium]MBR5587544.1 crossover junction endodeoxyribonuclease RuvC [Kiritimatiellia bacterium]
MALERIIIGFDTSLRSTGIGVVQVMGSARKALHYAPVRIPQTRPMSQALQLLDAEVTRILDTFHPTEAALETVFYAKNARTAMILCHARGVVVMNCAKRGIPVYEYSPSEIKRAVTGTGSAEKPQVQAMVSRILALPPPIQNDAADALAIALTHIHRTTGVIALQPPSI